MASGFHILEGRWLRNRVYTEDYIKFWLAHPYETTNYTSWMFDSMYEFAVSSNIFSILEKSLDSMVECFETWERGFMWNDLFMGKTEIGIYQNIDDRDGSECSRRQRIQAAQKLLHVLSRKSYSKSGKALRQQ